MAICIATGDLGDPPRPSVQRVEPTTTPLLRPVNVDPHAPHRTTGIGLHTPGPTRHTTIPDNATRVPTSGNRCGGSYIESQRAATSRGRDLRPRQQRPTTHDQPIASSWDYYNQPLEYNHLYDTSVKAPSAPWSTCGCATPNY